MKSELGQVHVKNINNLKAEFEKRKLLLLPQTLVAEAMIEKKILFLEKEIENDAAKDRYETQPVSVKAG